MLRAVVLCVQEVSECFKIDICQNGIVLIDLSAYESGETQEVVQRLRSVTEKYEVLPEECLVIATERLILQAVQRVGMKCIGYSASETEDLFGCCEYVVESWEDIGYNYINRVFSRLEGLPITIMETERLILRELVLQDVPRLCEICQSASIRRFMKDIGDDMEEEAEKHRAYIQQAYQFYEYGFWGIYDRNTLELIGRCGIQDSLIDGVPEVELGYLLAEEFRGKGLAKEAIEAVLEYAFRDLCLTRVVAQISPENTPSLHVAKCCGMQWEKDVCNGKYSYGLYVITAENHGQVSAQKSNR